MTNSGTEISPLVYARLAGFAYIVIILLGVFSVNFMISGLVVSGNDTLTINNIKANELQFRIGIVAEIVMYVLVVFLSLALYVILKNVNKYLALLALLWRTGEAIIGAGITVMSGLIPLILLDRETGLDADQFQALIGSFLDVRTSGLDLVLIFIGFGGTLFCYLFYISKCVPRILAAWGIFTYLSMLILAVTSILTPNISETTKMIFYAPGGMFELLFGLWLLIKGVNTGQLHKEY